MFSMFFHEIKSRDSLMKELAIQKTKIDIAYKTKPDQNKNVKPKFGVGSSNIVISQSMETSIKRKARFIMNECRNRSRKCCENRDCEARQILCQAAKKRMKTTHGNLDD